ncbi:HAD-like protein [Penicillium verhagenii]|uniref:HAD-like protein n=1 Tax=Penicillium verhagenii TaxID=1562060 RepID=UPI002544EC1E|nr:HAD-like protein [Penicillium verhagenii]KAJ5928243.1 HAD-like protein [Penicillium verhagenii]
MDMANASIPSSGVASTVILVELGDVVLETSFKALTAIPIFTFKSIMHCCATYAYQQGASSRPDYIRRLQAEFELSEAEIECAFDQVHATYTINTQLLAFLKELKSVSKDIKIYAFAKIGKEEYDRNFHLPVDWAIFDHIFASYKIGMRNPQFNCFHHVLDSINKPAHEILFVDRDTDNVMTAASLGMKGVVFDGAVNFQQTVRNMVFDPVARGKAFLRRNKKTYKSISANGVAIDENFAQLMILEATGDDELVEIDHHETTWNYFIGTPVLTQTVFPDDLDTTSLALMVLIQPDHIVHGVLDRMLEYVNEDGIILTFFTSFKNRVDPVVCVNVLGLFYRYGRGHQLSRTLEWLKDVLIRRAYMHGTAFYPTPEHFLFFFSRFLGFIKESDSTLHDELAILYIPRLKERLGTPCDSVGLSMRLIACNQFGIADQIGLETLKATQCEDGGWDMGLLYQYASKKLKIGNRGVSTALAVSAIESFPWPNGKSIGLSNGVLEDFSNGVSTNGAFEILVPTLEYGMLSPRNEVQVAWA